MGDNQTVRSREFAAGETLIATSVEDSCALPI